MKKYVSIIAAALALGAAAAPAFAAAASDDNRLPVTYDAKHDKYCVSEDVTGSIMPNKVCHTKAQWAKLGAVVGQPADTKLAQK